MAWRCVHGDVREPCSMEAGEVAYLSIYLFASWQRPASSRECMYCIYIEAKMLGGLWLAIARMLHGKCSRTGLCARCKHTSLAHVKISSYRGMNGSVQVTRPKRAAAASVELKALYCITNHPHCIKRDQAATPSLSSPSQRSQ